MWPSQIQFTDLFRIRKLSPSYLLPGFAKAPGQSEGDFLFDLVELSFRQCLPRAPVAKLSQLPCRIHILEEFLVVLDHKGIQVVLEGLAPPDLLLHGQGANCSAVRPSEQTHPRLYSCVYSKLGNNRGISPLNTFSEDRRGTPLWQYLVQAFRWTRKIAKLQNCRPRGGFFLAPAEGCSLRLQR